MKFISPWKITVDNFLFETKQAYSDKAPVQYTLLSKQKPVQNVLAVLCYECYVISDKFRTFETKLK